MARYRTANFSAADSRDFADQNTERVMQLTNHGLTWMREIAEQNLIQSRAMFESLLTITRNAVNDTDQEMYDSWQRCISLAEETFEFAHKLIRAKEPEELAHLQSEFVSQQAQALVDKATELGKSVIRDANQMAQSAVQGVPESSPRRPQAA
jgi:hypothetical protein